MDSGEDLDFSDPQRKKKNKRSHRHSPHQIQELEASFRLCPHPDDKQRNQLSRDLGLNPKQIKFWFQNRRTQMKAQQDRANNCAIREENDKVRCENIMMLEALKNIVCPSCGGPPPCEDPYINQQKLRLDNARLRDELDRAATTVSKYLGRPLTHLSPMLHFPTPPTVSSPVNLDPIHDPTSSAPAAASMSFPFTIPVTEQDKAMMVIMATGAMEDVLRLAQTNEPLWIKSDGREVLDLETYSKAFSRPGNRFEDPNIHIEASRDSGVVLMNPAVLVGIFMDSNKWTEFFSPIVSNANTIEVVGTKMGGSGALLLMQAELHVLSPVVPSRELLFLRYCQLIEQGLWVIADVSVEKQFSNGRSRRLPSGCLIQDMSNGYSKVTWVEHMEIEEKTPTHQLFRILVHSGMAFGAQRWLATLYRMCERSACLIVAGTPNQLGGDSKRRNMLQLAQRMVKFFCTGISSSNSHPWKTLSKDVGVRITTHQSTDLGHPSGLVLSAASCIWLPVSFDTVFSYFKDDNARAQWDVLTGTGPTEEIACITNGSHPGNCISLLRSLNSSDNTMLLLQESCIDASGSLLVYAPVEIQSVGVVMSGEDPSHIPLLPSGFTIIPDGQPIGASSSSNPSIGAAGSLLTVFVQILASSLPCAKVSLETVTIVNNIILDTVQQIKAGLNCASI